MPVFFLCRLSHILQNQILCDLHFADVALMECSDFMQQLRSFKPQSLGCAVARRKSSTTLIFPLPPQACSGMYHLLSTHSCTYIYIHMYIYTRTHIYKFAICTIGVGHISRVLWSNRDSVQLIPRQICLESCLFSSGITKKKLFHYFTLFQPYMRLLFTKKFPNVCNDYIFKDFCAMNCFEKMVVHTFGRSSN